LIIAKDRNPLYVILKRTLFAWFAFRWQHEDVDVDVVALCNCIGYMRSIAMQGTALD